MEADSASDSRPSNDDGSELESDVDTAPEPIVAQGEWAYFSRQLFRVAILQLLSVDLTATGKRAQQKGGLVRRAKRLLIARDPWHCCEAIRPMLQPSRSRLLPSLLREHQRLICNNVNLSNQVWIPQAQYAVYRNFSTEFHVCHEDHVQTQFGRTKDES